MENEGEELEGEGFDGLLHYTFPGYILGLVAGIFLDIQGYQTNPFGQWIVRTLAGEGESILEGLYSIRQHLEGAAGSMAQAYGWGKFFGITIPWIIDAASRMAGVDVYGIQGFYIPYFYALSDQIGANISGLVYLKRIEGTWSAGIERYLHHPVMLTSIAVILLVPLGLLSARILGFSPTTQTFTAFETIVANLCWLPPVVGWMVQKGK